MKSKTVKAERLGDYDQRLGYTGEIYKWNSSR